MKPALFRPLIFWAVIFPLAVHAQFSPAGSARSISGQFIVIGSAENSPLAESPNVASNADFVRLEPALLAVSAERIRESLWRTLGINSATPWRGRIFFTLHPARSLDEEVTIAAKPSGGGWSCQVQFPDVLSRQRYTRVMTSVLLLEFASRSAPATTPVEIPAWLIDGLSQQLLATGLQETILSSPGQTVNGLPVSRIDMTEQKLDPLAGARRVLKNFPALTFEQLSWPTDAQLSGDDDGVYRVSAQLFVNALWELKNGPEHLRALLESLPHYYNWQTAFHFAFSENFSRPLDLEKWWALQVVGFAARDPGPRWTSATSCDHLDEILRVPVQIRTASNAMPARAEISLQAVIRNFDSARQATILQTKLRDLELAEFRMAPQLAALTDAYRRALADYLGEGKKKAPVDHASPKKISANETLKKLDALDARRRATVLNLKPNPSFQPNRAPENFERI